MARFVICFSEGGTLGVEADDLHRAAGLLGSALPRGLIAGRSFADPKRLEGRLVELDRPVEHFFTVFPENIYLERHAR